MSGSDESGDASDVPEHRWLDLRDRAEAILGDRLAYFRLDRDGDLGAVITVIDLRDDDVDVLQEAASQLGVGVWTRVERAEPADLRRWESLRRDLIELEAERPEVLRAYPTFEPAYQRPPVRIELGADDAAVAVAAALHERHGDFVALRVGALPYPAHPDRDQNRRPWDIESGRELVDPAELVVALDGPLSVPRGQTASHAVVLRNTSKHPISISTNGSITAVIVDPASATPIGGFAGPQFMPLVMFRADPGQTVRIPLLVGTTSYRAELGFSVPAGLWQLVAPLNLEDGRRLMTAPMEFAITD